MFASSTGAGARLLAVTLLSVALVHCGKTKRSDGDAGQDSSGGSGGGRSSGESASVGGTALQSTGSATTGGGGASGGSGGAGVGGTGGLGGSGSEGGSAAAGAAGAPVFGDGLQCKSGEWCEPGWACINCDQGGDAIDLMCVPHPDRDPGGFFAATDRCPAVYFRSECDGPEDCPDGQYCTLQPFQFEVRVFVRGQCAPEALSCADSTCTLCRRDADCPEHWSCVSQGSDWDLGDYSGCVADQN